MPKYEFACPVCAATYFVSATMRESPYLCLRCSVCKQSCRRIYSIPQLVTERFVDRPENNPYPGKSQTEITEIRKAEDKRYEVQHSRQSPAPLPPGFTRL